MNRWMVDHDPETGRVQVYRLELAAVIERTGRVYEDKHEVTVRQVAGRDFTDGNAADALGEVLGLDPSTFGEVGWAEQQERLRRQAEGGGQDG